MISSSSIMRRKLKVQKRVLIENAFGEAETTWQDSGFLNGSVEPLKGREFFAGGGTGLPQRQSEIDARIRIRFHKGFNPAENRFVHDGVVYDLVAVIHDHKNRQTQLMVKVSAIKQTEGGW